MRIQSAFEQAGILFLDDNAGGGIGVRLQKKPQQGQVWFCERLHQHVSYFDTKLLPIVSFLDT